MAHCKLQPSGDRILIQYREPRRPDGTSFAREAARGQRSDATVVAVGPGRKGRNGKVTPLGLKIGDRIVVDRSRGINIRLKERSYAVIRENDLQGVK